MITQVSRSLAMKYSCCLHYS
uniref:Uncharacterized protein n=1 Tax=Anguilla anguilla TaxID=7936 RepID=A0A0E9UKB8_ANGAN